MAGRNPVFEYTFDDAETEFQEKASKGFEPIPRGWYRVAITDVKLEGFKEGSAYVGKNRLNLSVKVLSGEHEGRTVKFVLVPLFPRWNPSAKRPEGTATSFHDFVSAAGLLKNGKLTIKDWNVLFGAELDAFIDVGEPNDKGQVFNEIKSMAGSWRAPTEPGDEGDGESGEIEFGQPQDEAPF